MKRLSIISNSLIFTPQSDHYTTVLLNYQNEKLNLKKGVNYYYNGDSKDHCLKEVININSLLYENVIYFGSIFKKLIR